MDRALGHSLPSGAWCARGRYPRAAETAPGTALAAQSEPADDGSIPGVVPAHEVRKESASLANELEQAAARVMILGELAQVLGQSTDALREERDLDLRRAGVTLVGGILRGYAFLGFPRERHVVLQPSIPLLR